MLGDIQSSPERNRQSGAHKGISTFFMVICHLSKVPSECFLAPLEGFFATLSSFGENPAITLQVEQFKFINVPTNAEPLHHRLHLPLSVLLFFYLQKAPEALLESLQARKVPKSKGSSESKLTCCS